MKMQFFQMFSKCRQRLLGMLVLLILIIKSTETHSQETNYDSLENEYGIIQHASVIFRHGDRSPTRVYPLDPFKDYSWPQGFGQLTNKGKRRLFELGKWFKLRYRKLIDQMYNREQIIAHSNYLDRCIMSAQCFLFGLYPGTGSEIWLEHETWQPIPVHSIPEMYDNMIHVSFECPELQRIIKIVYNSPKIHKIFQKYSSIIQIIQNNTGENLSNTTAEKMAKKLKSLATTLLIEHQNNLTLPAWTKQIYPEPLRTIVRETIYLHIYHPVGKRLTAGPLLKSIKNEITHKTNNEKFLQKLHLYSGSDTILENVMIALNVYNHIRPYFGSALIFELRKKDNDNWITISYKNATDKEPFLLNATSLGEFLKFIEPLIPENWNNECQISSSFSPKVVTNNWYFVLVITTYIFF